MASSEDALQSLAEKHRQLVITLNLDEETASRAWKTFETIWSKYTLEGPMLNWLGCAIFVACRKTAVKKSTALSTNQGSLVSLTSLLISCNLSFPLFFNKIKQWISMENLGVEFQAKIENIERSFEVSHLTFKEFPPIFKRIFQNPQEVTSHRDRNRRQKSTPCTTFKVFDFCWLLFITLKGSRSPLSLTTAREYLIFCCDLAFGNALLENRRDLLNPNFEGLPDNWSDSDLFIPPKSPPCIIHLLCPADSLTDTRYTKEYSARQLLTDLFTNGTLQGNITTFSGLFHPDVFELNYKQLTKLYEGYLLSKGDFDERIFTGEFRRQLMKEQSLIGNESVCNDAETRSATAGNCPHTPLTGRRFLGPKEPNNSGDVTNNTGSNVTHTPTIAKLLTLLNNYCQNHSYTVNTSHGTANTRNRQIIVTNNGNNGNSVTTNCVNNVTTNNVNSTTNNVNNATNNVNNATNKSNNATNKSNNGSSNKYATTTITNTSSNNTTSDNNNSNSSAVTTVSFNVKTDSSTVTIDSANNTTTDSSNSVTTDSTNSVTTDSSNNVTTDSSNNVTTDSSNNMTTDSCIIEEDPNNLDFISDELLDILRDCRGEPLPRISATLRRLGEVFAARCDSIMTVAGGGGGGCSGVTAQSITDLGKRLFYMLLTCMLQHERLLRKDISPLVELEIFYKCLFACSLEIVVFSHNATAYKFPFILDTLELDSFYFVRVIELIVRSKEQLPRELVKHLNYVEEEIFSTIMWKSNSLLWEALRKNGNDIPKYEDVALPGHVVCSGDVTTSAVRRTNNNNVPKSPGFSAVETFQSPLPVHLNRTIIGSSPVNTVVKRQLVSTVKPGQSLLQSTKINNSNDNSKSTENSTANQQQTTETLARPKKSGSLNIIFRKFYNLACVRFEHLCGLANITDLDLKCKMWTVFEHSIIVHTDLMKDRHLDQILLCAVYIICRVTKSLGNIKFADLLQYYRKQPQACNDIYRNVLITRRREVREGAAGSVVVVQQEETRSDVILFYNNIYVQDMKGFSLKFSNTGAQSGASVCDLLLSPLPDLKSLTESPRRQVAKNVFIIAHESPAGMNHNSNQSSSYVFNRSASKDLSNINEAINRGDSRKRALVDFDAHLSPSPIKKPSTVLGSNKLTSRVKDLLNERKVQHIV